MLEEMTAEATARFDAGEFGPALAGFSVVREIRARREGPYSVDYLAASHACVRCLSELGRWPDNDVLCTELHGKYVRTHGRGGEDTVDVAKHWAWSLVQLGDLVTAAQLYLSTADATWESDPAGSRRLLAAAAVQAPGASPVDLIDGAVVDGARLRHTAEVIAALDDLARELAADDAPDHRLTFDGVSMELPTH